MEMNVRTTTLVLALGLLPGCAFNPHDRNEPDYEAMAADVPSAPCLTAAPDPADFEGEFTLGIIPDAPGTEAYLSAWPTFDGERFSVVVQPRDAETGELVGAPQVVEAGSLDVAGRFAIDEVVLDFPEESMGAEAGKAGLAAVEGGFCLRSASIQGTFEGWTFGPEPTEAGGYWFIARAAE